MPFYDYICLDCREKTDCDEDAVFETRHSMSPSEEELKEKTECPRCDGHNTEQYLGNKKILGHIRGDGLVKDRDGAKRDMSIHTLENNDPYGYMREPGEVDDLKHKLKRAGKHDPKTQYFT